eukprot:gb/GEZN01002640.1/.p1 GENE.gb/GEZN01002640.1/~~gb/GEZN01002640.1/.p1  ORF type:complete len:449 (-),score=58.02 gb/GEZN01002640.1/:91-1437(-)
MLKAITGATQLNPGSSNVVSMVVTYTKTRKGEMMLEKVFSAEAGPTGFAQLDRKIDLAFMGCLGEYRVCFVLIRSIVLDEERCPSSKFGFLLWQGSEISADMKQQSGYHFQQWCKLAQKHMRQSGVTLLTQLPRFRARKAKHLTEGSIQKRLGLLEDQVSASDQVTVGNLSLSDEDSDSSIAPGITKVMSMGDMRRQSGDNPNGSMRRVKSLASLRSRDMRKAASSNSFSGMSHVMSKPSLAKLLDGNINFVDKKTKRDPAYFSKLAVGQSPEFLWIGCADSRVPETEITGTSCGQLFVHRNVANIVSPTDLNFASVLQYAVEYLKVKQIIVCGHYGCGGCAAASGTDDLGIISPWLKSIKQVIFDNEDELEDIEDKTERADRLVELNVEEQVSNLIKYPVVQQAIKERGIAVHGWVFSLKDGLLKDLEVSVDSMEAVPEIFRYAQQQ